MNHSDKKLKEWSQDYEALDVPDSIDDYIKTGIKKGLRRKRFRYRAQMSALAAFVLLACFAGAVRISPAFAAYANTIPGIRNLAQLINNDKGLQDAVSNNFIQKMNRSVSHDGVTFTVNGVIADDSRMIFFYSIHSLSSKSLRLQLINVLNENGKSIRGGITYDPKIIRKKVSDKVSVGFGQSAQIPNAVNLKVHMKLGQKDWLGTVKVSINKQRFEKMKQVLPIHKTISAEHQSIRFEKAIIYPTRIAVYVHFNSNNSKHIFGFDQMKLVDGKGEVWSEISNGVSGTILSPNEQLIYFQSNYFREPKKLFLEGTNIRVLDKSEMNVLVNLKTKKLLKKPDNKLTLKGVSKTPKGYIVKFNLKTNRKTDTHLTYGLVGSIHDANGKAIQSPGSETIQIPGNRDQQINIKIKNSNFKEPLTFHIDDYPNRILKKFRIRIK